MGHTQYRDCMTERFRRHQVIVCITPMKSFCHDCLYSLCDLLFLGSAVSRCSGGACGSVFSECVGVGGPASRRGVASPEPPAEPPLLATAGADTGGATMRGSAAANSEPHCLAKHFNNWTVLYTGDRFFFVWKEIFEFTIISFNLILSSMHDRSVNIRPNIRLNYNLMYFEYKDHQIKKPKSNYIGHLFSIKLWHFKETHKPGRYNLSYFNILFGFTSKITK